MSNIKLCDKCAAAIYFGGKFGVIAFTSDTMEFRNSDIGSYKNEKDLCESCFKTFMRWWSSK